MNSLGRTKFRGEAIADGRFFAALAILIANDQWWKSSYPSWVTGKLSDFAGMVVFPAVLASFAAVVAPSMVRSHKRVLHLASASAAGLLLAAIKLSPAAAGAVESILAFITRGPQQIVVDPTDLIGLVALPLSLKILETPKPLRIDKRVRPLLLAAAALACVATSPDYDPPPENWDDVNIEGDQIRVERGRYGSSEYGIADTGGRPWVSIDDGVTWTLGQTRQPAVEDVDDNRSAAIEAREEALKERQITELCLPREPGTCIRLIRNRILETTNGGENWDVIWEVNPSESWARAQWDVIKGQDLAVTESGAVIVAMGSIGPLRRAPSGEWSPSVAQLRVMPDGIALFALGLAILAGAVVAFVRANARIAALLTAGVGGFIYVSGWNAIVDDNQSSGDPFEGYAILILYFAVMAALLFAGLVSLASRKFDGGQFYALRPKDFLPLTIGCALVPIPFGIWALGFLGWNAAIFTVIAVSLAVLYFSYVIAGDPIERVRSASPKSNPAGPLSPARSVPLPQPEPPLPISAQPTNLVNAATAEWPTSARAQFIGLGVIGAGMPALAYASALGQISASWLYSHAAAAALAPLSFWLQGVVLNQHGIRRKAWRSRVSLVLIVGFVGSYFAKRHGPLPTWGPTLGTAEVLLRGVILAGVVALIYLGGRRAAVWPPRAQRVAKARVS